MSNLELTMACGVYDRTEALRSGAVTIEGVDLNSIAIQWPVGIFSQMIRDQAFDIAEMSLSHSFVLKARGEFPFVTLPVFPSRYFRHGLIFVNSDAGISEPKDLANKRIGVQGYQMTAAVWIRGILQHEYGVGLQDVRWFEGGVNQPEVPGGDVMTLRTTEELAIERIPEEQTLSAMLAEGEIDALIGAIIPDSYRNSGKVVRLFPNYREEERNYFARTGIFPIMHSLVIKETLCSEHPWLIENVYRGFEDAKQWAIEMMRFSGSLRYMLPWLFEHIEEMDDVLGGDPWAYGFEANRAALEAFGRFVLDQHFISEPVVLEDIVAPIG